METLKDFFRIGNIITWVWVPIVVNYYSTFLPIRFKNKAGLPYAVWGIYIIPEYLLMRYITQWPISAICAIMAWTLIAICLYVSSLKTALLVSASFFCIGYIAESIVVFGFMAVGIVLVEGSLLGWVISKLIILIIIQIIRSNRKSVMKGEVTLVYWLMSVLIPIGSIVIVYTIQESTYQLIETRFSVMSSAIIMVINIFIFRVYDKMQKDAAIRQENVIYEQQAKMFKQQCEEREAIWLESRKLYHDFKNHLICLKGFSESRQYDEFDDYIETLVDNYTTPYWQTKSGNMIIDSLLSYKTTIAEKDGLTIKTDFSIWTLMPFEDYDLCIIVGNILDNAIEAAGKVAENKPEIELVMKFSRNIMAIKISNPYTGNLKTDIYGKLLTTKPDKINHGMGMKAVEKTVKKYDGFTKIEKDNGIFELTIIMYGKRADSTSAEAEDNNLKKDIGEEKNHTRVPQLETDFSV